MMAWPWQFIEIEQLHQDPEEMEKTRLTLKY